MGTITLNLLKLIQKLKMFLFIFIMMKNKIKITNHNMNINNNNNKLVIKEQKYLNGVLNQIMIIYDTNMFISHTFSKNNSGV